MDVHRAGMALAVVLVAAASSTLVSASGFTGDPNRDELAGSGPVNSRQPATQHLRQTPAPALHVNSGAGGDAAGTAKQPAHQVDSKLVTPTTAHRSSDPWEVFPFDLACMEPVPAAAGVAGLTDDGRTVTLEVLVVLDRLYSMERATALMERAADVFVPLGIRLESTYEIFDLSGTEIVSLMEQVQGAAGRFSLDHIDVVHVLTGIDLTYHRNRSVGGMASCIGGIRYKKDLRSFSISEAWYQDAGWLWPTQTIGYKDRSALIVAHEIGHLLGAHHHYGNCIENADAVAPAEQRALSPCTVMDQTLFYSSLRFGYVEGAVVRGHAVDYASP